MTIDYAILGLLSLKPLSGYDLKKIFEDSIALYWSGNNNEIYRALLDLRDRGLVDCETLQQESLPARKVYSITAEGQQALAAWAQTPPALPQKRHTLLIQLAWADALPAAEIDRLLAAYEDELANQILICQRQMLPAEGRARFLNPAQARTPREALLWQALLSNYLIFYLTEQGWVRQLRRDLANLQP